MRGKYSSFSAYAAARLKRTVLRTSLRPLVSWDALDDVGPGYTVIMACHAPLAEMLLPNLGLLAQQDLTDLRKLIIVFDRPEDERLRRLAGDIARCHPQLNCQFAFRSRRQRALLRRINWGWVDCWLSYCKGIAATRTRYAVLHDMDAMLLRRDLLRDRYDLIRQRGDHFLGHHWYHCNGLVPDDHFVYIVEMAFDVEYLRRTCKPLDLFNVVGRLDGRFVDYDTLLYPQTRTHKRSIAPIEETEMVHPSEVIGQYTLLDRSGYVPPGNNSALFIPYFYYLAGDTAPMSALREGLRKNQTIVPLLDRPMDVSRLTAAHAQWLAKQAMRIEHAVAGAARADVVAYFDAIREAAERSCGGARFSVD